MWDEASRMLLRDEYIGPLVKKYGACTIRPCGSRDYFSNLARAIVDQQLSGRVADVIYERFERLVGVVSPRNVLKVSEQDLRNCGMSWAKVASIIDLAKKTRQGKLRTGEFAFFDDEEVKRELTLVRGIGNWTAEMFLMFTLGRPDVFPSDDLGIKNGMSRIFGVSPREMTRNRMEEIAERWKPYRTVASWYIWRSLENR
jgi:DNA-3-methyladenine glycosylase II